ncbi:MAG: leucine--tRNA ligase, partial [Monoglobales bacterium]
YDEVLDYVNQAAKKTEFERTELAKEKTGVELKGIKAVNPVNGSKISVWISDYVLTTYGTGAIMAVPAHDMRDHEFATKFDLPIIEVVAGGEDVQKEAFTDVANGTLVNSGFLTGKNVAEAIPAMIDWLEEKGIGNRKINFKLRDWVFSRQRYWGEPIPLVWCDSCGWVSIGEENLPLTLPDTENFEPGENGESPLSKMEDWVKTDCPKCGGPATRETDTMPQWAGSSWYFLRYTDAHNDSEFASKENIDYWMPVDWYNGGMEHTTLHLLYSRFWHKFLFDLGLVSTSEPYVKRTSHGMILGENGEKMSKSRGNVINPDEIVNEYGADTFRTYEMFIGAFDQATPWSMQGVKGCYRFLERVWALQFMLKGDMNYSAELETAMHKAVKKVGEDIERMKFNTAIATLMALVNDFNRLGRITKGELKTFLQLLNPIAPHITEEMWSMCGFEGELAYRPWPQFDPAKTVDDEIEIVLQVNGKIVEKMNIPSGLDRAAMEETVKATGKLEEIAGGKTIVKVICVPGKLVNIVVK